jgi:hypothetical protein
VGTTSGYGGPGNVTDAYRAGGSWFDSVLHAKGSYLAYSTIQALAMSTENTSGARTATTYEESDGTSMRTSVLQKVQSEG